MDIPTCQSCAGFFYGSEDPCLCERQKPEDLAGMVQYAAYVMQETAEAMKRNAGIAQSVDAAELLKHGLEMENAAATAETWAEGIFENV